MITTARAHILNVNLKGVFLCLKYEARAMLATGRGGAIVNAGSINLLCPGSGRISGLYRPVVGAKRRLSFVSFWESGQDRRYLGRWPETGMWEITPDKSASGKLRCDYRWSDGYRLVKTGVNRARVPRLVSITGWAVRAKLERVFFWRGAAAGSRRFGAR